ncbi:unnamed protein product [Calypogeia fissa]
MSSNPENGVPKPESPPALEVSAVANDSIDAGNARVADTVVPMPAGQIGEEIGGSVHRLNSFVEKPLQTPMKTTLAGSERKKEWEEEHNDLQNEMNLEYQAADGLSAVSQNAGLVVGQKYNLLNVTRAPRIVSLKHHWWWMMNTIWDGLQETRNRDGHILFIEEDHYILPNAYRTLQLLSKVVGTKCPECVAVNLAPAEVSSRGEGEGCAYFVAEKVGNVGYALNRTIWNWMHARSEPFCEFDDYNWDITLWGSVYPTFPTSGYTLRGPKSSAIHFGKCGLHQGQHKTFSLKSFVQ